jgi:hypothetical protein
MGCELTDAVTLRNVIRLDSIKLDKTYFTSEGYLVDHPVVTTTGIFEYTKPDGSIRRELRLPEEVFNQESLDSYKGKPVIITHNAGEINKDNVEQEHIGTILTSGYRDGENVKVEIVIHDTDAMKRSGLRELSLGYNLKLEETPGEWNGQPYDAIQREIRVNHLALVAEARAGEKARLNIDSSDTKTNILKGEKSMTTSRKDSGTFISDELTQAIDEFKKRRADRIAANEPAKEEVEIAKPAVSEQIPPVDEPKKEVEDSAEGSLDKVQSVKARRAERDIAGDPDSLELALGIIAQQDEDIEALLNLIEVLQAKSDFNDVTKKEENPFGKEDADDEDEDKVMNADSVDRIVRTRVELARIGDRLNLDGLDTMSIIDAKKAIVKKIKPQMRLDGKSSTYINAAFDLAMSEINSRKDTDYQRRQIFNSDSKVPVNISTKTAAQRSREKMIARRNGGNE